VSQVQADVLAAALAPPAPQVSVVIATYNRGEAVALLLHQLAEQSLEPSRFEVVVVDDGSAVAVAPALRALSPPYTMLVLSQTNAGPAAARHNAISHARGDIVVVVDDDMHVGPTFLAEHIAAHPAGTRRVVLGPIRPRSGDRLPLFERCHLALVRKLEERVRTGRTVLRGTYLYTGNVSFRRDDYLAVGGFDTSFRISEDAELGVRLDLAGAEFRFADGATAWHASDHTSLKAWMGRSMAYGGADSRVSEKHPGLQWANPWRFLFLMHPASRALLLASALIPWAMRPIAWLGIYVSLGLGWLGAERVAIAGATVVYGLQYFAGVRAHAGSLKSTMRSLTRYYRGLRIAAARHPLAVEQSTHQ
jgi:GT2 family glycosyltransferase